MLAAAGAPAQMIPLVLDSQIVSQPRPNGGEGAHNARTRPAGQIQHTATTVTALSLVIPRTSAPGVRFLEPNAQEYLVPHGHCQTRTSLADAMTLDAWGRHFPPSTTGLLLRSPSLGGSCSPA